MFEVLVFVYENYFASDSRPEPANLERKLNAVGFEADEVIDAMNWLRGLNAAALGSSGFHSGTSPMGMQQPAPPEPWLREPSTTSVRIYPANEQRHLGALCLGFISFLECAGVMSAPMREVVIDRAMAAPGAPVALDDFKIIILMVYWSFGQVPDALILDELCEDNSRRVAH
jgi:Smg protein